MSRDWLLYLEDIAQAAEKIGRFTHGMVFDNFQPQSPIFDAVLFNLQIIGEATKNLPDEARSTKNVNVLNIPQSAARAPFT